MVPAQLPPTVFDAFFVLAERMLNVDLMFVTIAHKSDAARTSAQATARARSIVVANMVGRDAGGRWHADICYSEGEG